AHKENDTNWAIPNEIEILLVHILPPPELDAELESAFATASRIAVPSREGLKRRAEAAVGPDDKRAVLATLLRDTHTRFAARRSERVARQIVARRLARLGLGLTLAIVAVLVILGYGVEISEDTELGYHLLAKYNLCVTTFFGFLGAYLSRLIAFQNGAGRLSFDDLENGYAWHFLLVRLLVGGLSALVLYFVIAGRLIGGELFPEPSAEVTGGFGALWQAFEDESYTGPTANFAKLIIWCFIAGFSERFLPDRLSALEAKAQG
ncbi:hypothetical protein, partial [Tabrizicola sp.]|uniref:hypothetical protein n=1 Tax=Tabrizicola sp. TaxID=2005166 RepID=UPI003F2E97AD